MLDGRKLRHVTVLAEAGSYARAAEVLNISQPALSQSIQAIEHRYGIRLFDRSRRGVTLTPSGRWVVADARRLLRESEILERNMQLLGTAQLGKVRFGLDPLCAGIFLVDLLAFLGAEHTGLKVEAAVLAATELERRLLDHEADLIVVPRQLLTQPDQIDALPLATVRVSLLVRPDHPLLGRGSLSLDDLAGFPFIAGSNPREVERMAIGHPLWQAPTIRCDNYGLMGDVVLQSDAIWMASSAFAVSAGGEAMLVELLLDESTPMPQTDVIAATLKGLTSSPAVDVIRHRLIERSVAVR